MLFTDRDLDALFPKFDDRTGAYERTALTMRTFLLAVAVATNTKSGIKFGPENGIQEAIDIWKGRSIEAVPLEIVATFTHLSGQRVTDITVPPTTATSRGLVRFRASCLIEYWPIMNFLSTTRLIYFLLDQTYNYLSVGRD